MFSTSETTIILHAVFLHIDCRLDQEVIKRHIFKCFLKFNIDKAFWNKAEVSVLPSHSLGD